MVIYHPNIWPREKRSYCHIAIQSMAIKENILPEDDVVGVFVVGDAGVPEEELVGEAPA